MNTIEVTNPNGKLALYFGQPLKVKKHGPRIDGWQPFPQDTPTERPYLVSLCISRRYLPRRVSQTEICGTLLPDLLRVLCVLCG